MKNFRLLKKEKGPKGGTETGLVKRLFSILMRRRLRRPKRPKWVKLAVGEKGKEVGGISQRSYKSRSGVGCRWIRVSSDGIL